MTGRVSCWWHDVIITLHTTDWPYHTVRNGTASLPGEPSRAFAGHGFAWISVTVRPVGPSCHRCVIPCRRTGIRAPHPPNASACGAGHDSRSRADEYVRTTNVKGTIEQQRSEVQTLVAQPLSGTTSWRGSTLAASWVPSCAVSSSLCRKTWVDKKPWPCFVLFRHAHGQVDDQIIGSGQWEGGGGGTEPCRTSSTQADLHPCEFSRDSERDCFGEIAASCQGVNELTVKKLNKWTIYI